MEPDSPRPADTGTDRTEWVEDEPVFLTSTDSAVDSRLLEGSLCEAGIPFDAKMHNDRGITRVFMGTSPLGADFYVPSKLLERARACIPGSETGSEPAADPPGFSSPAGAGEEKPDAAGRRHPAAVIVTALALAALLLAFYAMDALLGWFRSLMGF